MFHGTSSYMGEQIGDIRYDFLCASLLNLLPLHKKTRSDNLHTFKLKFR